MAEEKNLNTRPITYGALISISLASDENHVIYSDGIIKTQVYLENMAKTQSGKQESFYRSLFQVYPSFINTYKKEALSLKDNMINHLTGHSIYKQKEHVEELKEKLTFEYKNNMQSFEKGKGSEIAFDQQIQFLHLASNKFLACHFKEADQERENYKLELVDIPSDATNFKISTVYKHQKKSEGIIYYGDFIVIAHASYYLDKTPHIQVTLKDDNLLSNFTKNVPAFETHNHNFGEERVQLDAHQEDHAVEETLKAKRELKKEINVSLEKSTRWVLNHFSSNPDEEKDFIFYGNTIWLNHVEFNASMIAKKHKQDSLAIDLVRATMTDHLHQYVGNTNGMWIIENDQHLVGGPVHWGDRFKLKHFSSGRYLTLTYNSRSSRSELVLENEATKESFFKFVNLASTNSKQSNSSEKKMINKEAFTRIQNCATELWVRVELDGEKLTTGLSMESLDDDIFRLVRANNSEIWETNFILSCFPILKEYLVFLDDPSRKENSFIWKNANKYKEVQECLIQLELFCTNRILNTSLDQKFGDINPSRQKVLREQYFLETLSDILKLSFNQSECDKFLEPRTKDGPAHNIKSSVVARFQRVAKKLFISQKKAHIQLIIDNKIKICQLIYSLITSICKGNVENEMYAYNLLRQFQYQTKYFQEAVDCFISVIGSNQTLLNRINESMEVKDLKKEMNAIMELDKLSTKKTYQVFNVKVIFDGKKNDKMNEKQNFIAYFLSLLQTAHSLSSKTSYIRFLRSLCTCGKGGVTKNQELLFQIFLNYRDVEKSVFTPMRLTETTLEIDIGKEKFISLSDCFSAQGEQLYQRELVFFQEQLSFYSDLLLDRNYLWKMRLEKKFPIKFVFEQIYNPALSLQLRSVFCDLAFALYIDHEPLNSKVVPNLCRVFKSNHLRNQPSLLTSTEKLQTLDQENFTSLLENLMKIVQEQKRTITKKITDECAKVPDDRIVHFKGEPFLDNILFANIMKLLSQMVRYDLLTLLNKNEMFSQMVHDLMHILEYEKGNPEISYTLEKTRAEQVVKVQEKGNIISALGDFMAEKNNTAMKNFADNALANQQKAQQAADDDDDEDEDTLHFSNPIMKGLLDIKQQLDKLVLDQERKENMNETIIKKEICTLFDFMIDLREDYLVSNILGWYDYLLYKTTDKANEITEEMIESRIFEVLPPVAKTGIRQLDQKFSINYKVPVKEEHRDKQVGEQLLFKKFTTETEIPDLDTLFARGKEGGSFKSRGVLPSLLMAFYHCTNTELQDKILTVIMRMFNQKQELAKNLSNLNVIFQKKDIAAYYKLEAWFTHLRLQTETSEIWLQHFINTKGENGEGVAKVYEVLLKIQKVFQNQSKQRNKHFQSRQYMVQNLAGFPPVVELIQDGVFHLKTVVNSPTFPLSAVQKLVQIFQLAHTNLIYFCLYNETNQKILADHLPLFLQDLSLEINQIPLICEILRDNRYICETYADLIISSISDAIVANGRKEEYLQPLVMLQSQKKIFSIDNQIKILDHFLAAKDEERAKKLLYGEITEGTKEVVFSFKKELSFDQPFIYHAKLLDVLALYDDNNDYLALTHVRLRKMFNVEYCLELAVQSDTLTNVIPNGKQHTTPKFGAVTNSSLTSQPQPNQTPPKRQSLQSSQDFVLIKPRIVKILHLLYLKADNDTAMELIQNMPLLNEFLNSELKRIESLPADYKPKQNYISYLVDALVPFFKAYTVRLIIESNEEQRDIRGCKIISAFAQKLHDQMKVLLPTLPHDKMRVVQEFLNFYCEDVNNFQSLVLDKDNTSDDGVAPPMQKEVKPAHNSRVSAAAKEESLTLNDSGIPIMKVQEQEEEVLDDIVNFGKFEESWHEFLKSVLSSNTLEEEIKNEKLALCEAIWNFKEIIPEEYRKKYRIDIETRTLIKKLIEYLQYGIYNKSDKATMISTLKILRTLIETAPNVKLMQDFLDKNDATKMLLLIFSDSKNSIKDDDLLSEFLSFWISLLEGGNQNVQKNIYNFCKSYQKSEVMFSKFYSIIYEEIEYLQVKMTVKNESENALRSFERSSIKPLILEKLLRLLQLFTEGHYLDLQNYLRHQTNSRHRYNIVEAVIELLRIYFQDLVQENYENILRCIDTLNEFVQGPCPENQIALIDGKFLDVAVGLLTKEIPKNLRPDITDTSRFGKSSSYISTGFALSDKNGNQNEELERWMLVRLKFKILILLNSLLEMRNTDSDSVVRRIMRSLPLQVLKTNLVKIYRRYKKSYGNIYSMDAFKHFEDDPRDRDNKNSIRHYELIIEAGFLTYFLISSYLEAKVQDVDLQNEIQEMQEGITEGDNLKSFLTNNVFGQLGKFLYSFLESSYDSLFKKSAQKRLQTRQSTMNKDDEKKILKAAEYRILVKEAFEFFSKNSAQIEVVRNGELEKVHFMLLPYCKEIPREKKQGFHEKVNRESPQTKVSDLVKYADYIIDICKHELRLKLFFGRNKVIAVFANFVNLWQDLAFLMSITLNILIIGSYSVINFPNNEEREARMNKPRFFLRPGASEELTETVFFALGTVMVISSAFVLIFYLLKRAPLVAKKTWEVNPNKPEKKDFFTIFKKVLETIYLSLKTPDILYFVAFAAFAVFGMAIHPFFYAFHLTQLVLRYPTLMNVIRAFYEPRRQLGLTFLLYMILTYIFSLVAFEFFHADYAGDCETTWSCFLTTFDFTFKVNGGIGGFLDGVTPPETGVFKGGRFFFDFLFNTFLVIIMASIVSGIIIDTFALLREQEEEKNKDIQEKCYVCGLSKELFEKQANLGYDFTKHIKRDHYMWNYIFFIAYLKDKDETEYTGIESYIHDKLIKSEVTSWFPLDKALALKNLEENEEEKEKRMISSFEKEIEEIKKDVKEITTKYEKMASQLTKI